MKSMMLSLAIVATNMLAARADWVVSSRTLGSLVSVDECTLMADDTDNPASGFSLSGVAVDETTTLRYNPITQPDEGSVIALGTLEKRKRVAILDTNPDNEETQRQLYSAQYMLDIAGLPSFVTTDATDAVAKGAMILISAYCFDGGTISDEDWNLLAAYVADGGILLCPGLERDVPDLILDLLGISSKSTAKEHMTITWADLEMPECAYFDTPEEQTVSLGQSKSDTMRTTNYTLNGATQLAWYDDDTSTVAALRNDYGLGSVYAFGVRWRDVIQRSHLNKDFNAQRSANNAYEPSADVYSFFIRALAADRFCATSWKYTVPGGWDSVLIPTHDCDSSTAYQAMHYLADYEESIGLQAHYFLTVHYFRQQGYMAAFYNDDNIPYAARLLEQGHTIGSHSLCHYPDFNVAERHPLTVYTEEEYPEVTTIDVDNSISYGSTWCEVVLSKQILERDLGNRVRSFRSGHLCVNKNMPEAHRIANYDFSSCYSALDVLSQFPFIQRMQNEWAGEPTGVLQMPLHFSDSFNGNTMTEENWPEKLEVWKEIFSKLKNNHSAAIVLVHPNREYKMEIQKALIDWFDPAEVGLWNFEAYGDFWLDRMELDFDTYFDAERRLLVIQTSDENLGKTTGTGIYVHAGDDVQSIAVIDENATTHRVRIKPIGDQGDYVVLL